MNRFVERVEPYFLSEDPFVQRYAIEMLEDTYLPEGDTFLTGLKAVDRGPVTEYSSPILPNLIYLPLNEEGLKEVVNRLDVMGKKDNNRLFYIQLITNASTELLTTYRKEVKQYVGEEQLQEVEKLPSLTIEELYMALADVMVYLDEHEFNQALYDHGKRIIKELVKKGGIESWEVQNGLQNKIDDEKFFGFEGIYNVYMAGEIQEESVVPQLVNLFKNEEEGDFLFEETANSLVKIGTDLVVREVENIALYGNTFFYTLDVLGRIKTKEAEKALLRLFDQADDPTAKTIIADNLCRHLSTDAIPRIEDLVETGYEDRLLCLEESLYVNCVMNGVQHPKLPEWRHLLEVMELEMLNEPPALIPQPVISDEKIGRNDPCPCGSGKKYKKCCL
ncbi:YecA family protein [Rossellomorea aquimaris]|uniref:SEC-C motif-containing protein n=1 Tax=Rossellomorea aquimaris TaxID=189382 RepID=A0A366EK61_9BACI|nr:SEC-C metal-binding domain-containing protein [Rossellomorea aquimaris]RBP02748.1 SEC-C motif-containing protein [Rossellomorea aquimaris]